MGNLVDCLKKAKRLNKYEKAAIRAVQQEYLPNAKTSAEADQMAVNSAIERVQEIISSIYQQAGVPQSRPVVVPASGPLAEPVTPTAVVAPVPVAQAPAVVAPLTPESSREEIIAQLSSIPMFRGVRGENTKSPKGAQYFTSSEDFAKTYSPKGIVGEHRVTLRNPLIVSMADWSDYSSSSYNPIGPIEKSLRNEGYDGVVMISTPRGSTKGEPLITVLALNSEKTTTFAPAVASATAVVAPEIKTISPNSIANRQEQAKKLSLKEYKAWRLGDNPIPLFKDKPILEAIAILKETEGNNKYLKLIEYLIYKFGYSNIKITSRDTLLDEGTLKNVGGFYAPNNNLIVLSRSSAKVRSYSAILAHEFLHALTVKIINKEKALDSRDQSKEYKKLLQLYNVAVEFHNQSGKEAPYGLKNLKEFISEAFSNNYFQEFLEGIPSGNKGTLWSDFVDAIRAILGISAKDGSLLKEVLKASEGIIKSQKSEAVYTSWSFNSRDYNYITTLEDEYKVYRGEPYRKDNIKRLGQGLLDLLEADDPGVKDFSVDSKVVDDQGKPLMVYHGTQKFEGSEFKPSKAVNRRGNPDGYYFTEDPGEASLYAEKDRGGENIEYGNGAQIIPVYLNIKNPYNLDRTIPVNAGMLRQYKIELLKENSTFGENSDWIISKLKFAKENNVILSQSINGNGDAFTRIIKAGGYDGVKDGQHWVAFEPTQIKSAYASSPDLLETDDNPSVDPNKDQEALPSSAANGVTLNSEFFPLSGKKIKNSGVANLLKDVMSEFWGKVITSANVTQRELDIIIRNGVNEFKAAFADSKKSAADWYSTAVEVAMEVASLIHPELNNADVAKSIKAFSSAEDPVQAANLVMRMAMAITSQNLAVTENTAYANEQYETFVKTGKFNPKRLYGEKAESISGNLELANILIEKYGFTKAEKFIRSTYSVKDLSKIAFDITGNKKNIDGYIDDMVQGAAIFGPKIGQGFLQNLMGNFDPVTIDLWLRRTWGRWTGDVVGDGVTPERLAKLLDAANKAGIPVPNELKNVKVITAKRGNGNNYRTIANDTAQILSEETDESTNFRDVINKFAKEVNADWQRQYKLLRQNVTPEIKAAVEAGELSLKQVVDEQSAFFDSIPKKPKEANLKEWRKQQYELAGRTEVIESDALKALKPKWAKAAKVIISNLNPIDQPSNLDRRVISKVVNGIREALKKEGINVTNADVQAVLWYPEKDIWAKLRGEQESNLKQSYDEEFIKIATERGFGPQANALAESIRQKRSAESVGTNRGTPTDTGNVEGADREVSGRDDAINGKGNLTERQEDLDLLDDEELGQENQPIEKGAVRGRSQSSLLEYEYAAKGTDEEKIAYGVKVADKYGDDFVGALAEMRQIENPAFRSIVAATILDRVLSKIEGSKVPDIYLESMYERLLSDVEISKTGAGQTLQAQNVVNDILRKHLAILAYRGVIKNQLEVVGKDFDPNAGTKFNEVIVGAGEKAGRVITESKDIVDPKIKEINDLIKTVGNILKPKKANAGLGQQIMELIQQSAGFRAFYTNKGIDGLAKNFWQLMAGPQAADGNIVTFDRVVTSELASILRNEMEKAGYENAKKPNLSTAEKIAMFLSNDPLKADKIKALDDAIRNDIAKRGEEEGAHLEELWDSIMGTMIESSSSEVTARRIVQETIKDLKLNWNDIIKGGKASIDSAKVAVINGVLDKVSKVSPGGSKLDLTQLQAQLGPIFDEIASVRQNRFDKNLAMAEARKVANDDPKVQALSIIDKLNKEQSFVGPNEIPKANPLRNAIADYLNGKITTEKFQEIMASLGLPAETVNSLLNAIDEQKSINEAWKQIDKSNDLSEFLSKYENYLKPIRSIARNLGFNLKEIFTGSAETADKVRVEIQKMLEKNDKFNALSENDKASLNESFYKAWEKIRSDIAQKEFNRLIPIVTVNKNAQVKEKLKKTFPKLIELSNLGLLNNDQFLKALGAEYGIKQFDSDVAKKLMELSKEAESLPEGSERNAVFQKIMDTIMDVRGANWRDLANDIWFRNVMSAPRTMFEIGYGGIIQGAARTMLSALDVKLLKENPMMALRFIGMFAQDVFAGMQLGLDLIVTGDRSISPRFQERFFAQMNKLEKGKSPGGYLESAYRNATGLKKAAIFPYEMLGRVLTALDYIGGQGIRSQQMLYAALVAGDKKSVDALMRRFDKAERAKAQAQAVSELGPNARNAQVIVRTREILSEGISDEIKAFGNHMTEVAALNAPPIGIGGLVYSQVSRLPLWAKAPAGLAFAKSALNLAQEISNWTPILGQINYLRTKSESVIYGLKGQDLNEARARQIFTAQVLGLAVTAAAASAFLGGDDEEDKDGKKKPRSLDITGGFNNMTPTQRKAAATAGLKEYSIIKNGVSYDYKQFPFLSNLAIIGHWRDQERFNNKKWDEETIASKVVDSWMMGITSVKDMSVTSQLSSIFGLLASDNRPFNPDTIIRGLISSIGGSIIGIVPGGFSSALREVDNYINQERYRTDYKNPGLDMFLAQVPFVRGMGELGDRPMFNMLGDNIKVSVTPINRHVGPPVSLDPVTRAFAEKIAAGMDPFSMDSNPPQINDTNLITGKKEKRDMTFEETYDYDRAVLRGIKRQMTSDIEAFKAATPKEASNYLDAVSTYFKAEVFKRMDLAANNRANPTEFEDFRKVPVNKNFAPTLTPEYDRVLKINAESAGERDLQAKRLSLDKDAFMKDRNMMNVLPENRLAVLRYAINPASYRNELQKKISNMAPSDAAIYVQEQLDGLEYAADRVGAIRELVVSGALKESVILEMVKQGSDGR